MKKFYSIIILILVFATSVIGQTRIYPPNLRAPVNNKGDQNPDVFLNWDAVTGQTTDITYEVQLSLMPDFAEAIIFPRTDVTALQMSELQFGKNYYWRVKAYDAEEPSDWSVSWMFSVTGSVDLTDPKIDKESYAVVLIKWEEITGLSKYELQIDTVYEWNIQADVTEDDIFGTSVLSSSDRWFVGENGMIQHFDGTVWTTMDAGVTENLNSIFMLDGSNGFIVGDGGSILSYNGTDWTSMDAGTTEDLTAVSFTDANNGWAVGNGGMLLKYSSGSWTTESNPATGDLNGVFALSTSNVWACGTESEVLHYDGSNWTGEEVGTRDHNDIWFVDQNNGWLVSKSGKIFYFNGSEWIEQESGTNKNLYSISFNGMHGFVVGDDGVMLNYLGGWRVVTSGTEEPLNSISVNGDAGLSAGDAGSVLLKSGDGFNSPYLRTIDVNYDSASYDMVNLLYGKTIYYRMRAMHSNDTTQWSGGRSVITYPSPELDKPNNGSDDADLLELFKWDEYEGSAEYFFQIADNEEFTNPFTSSSDSTSTNYQMKRFGQTFYWRVRAIHATDASEYSEPWTLTTANNVNLSSPDDGEVDVAFCPSYEWDEIIGSVGYEMWLDTDENFANAMKVVTAEPAYQCTESLERKITYYWKVRAMTTIDTSEWSETWSFTVEGYAGIGDGNLSGEMVEIYPNPTEGDISLVINSYANDVYLINIFDMTGKQVYEDSLKCKSGENSKMIVLSEIQSGMYMVQIRRQDQVVTKKLFVK